MTLQKYFLQPTRFVMAGGLATASHWFIMAVMVESGIQPSMATATGAIIGAIGNYFLQHEITFNSKVKHRNALLPYLFSCVLLWLSNLSIFIFFYRVSLLSPFYSQCITSFIVSILSYFFYKRIVFNEKRIQTAN